MKMTGKFRNLTKISLCACSVTSVVSSSLQHYGPPGSSVHGILQARILEWVAMPSSRDETPISCVSYVAGGFFIPHKGNPKISLRNPIQTQLKDNYFLNI